MANGQEPWWLSAIYKVGIPSAIAVYLTYILVTTITMSMTSLQSNQVQFAEQLRLHAVDSSYILKETSQIKVILQQICANTADTKIDRDGCFIR
jgi:hypothetical protein